MKKQCNNQNNQLHNTKSDKLSINTKNYLTSFYCILDEMIQGMTEAELTDSISRNFMVQMIPHHQAAIEMSKSLLKYTTNIPLQDIALGIIEEQTKSIEDMRKILGFCSKLTNSRQDVGLYQRKMDRIMENMFRRMEAACSGNCIDCNFMREMIPHHEGAIEMSENTLQYDICPQLRPILDAIITSQKKGVMEMKQLLRCMKCE